MRGRRSATVRSQKAASFSLFPFLAVLICTMGALILLLVILAHQSRLQAVEAARASQLPAQEPAGEKPAAKPAPLDPDRERELIEGREDAEWRAQQIRAAREQTEKDLTTARLELGNVEEHFRDLMKQFDQLQSAAAELDQLQSTDQRRKEQLEEELNRLKAQLEEAKRRLEEQRKAAGEKPPSYAVVPYEGPHGTRRRPIYVECRSDAIILQPEGIQFIAEDFAGPLGPGNPLDAALRAVREYLLNKGQFDRSVGEPYPLLLVRPEGIAAYDVARQAMQSWGSEFGYEVVDADWQLSFPPPDPALVREVELAVNEARLRQHIARQLAGGMPGGSGGGTGGGYGAGTGNGGGHVGNAYIAGGNVGGGRRARTYRLNAQGLLEPKQDLELTAEPKPRRQPPAGPYADRFERSGAGPESAGRGPESDAAGGQPGRYVAGPQPGGPTAQHPSGGYVAGRSPDGNAVGRPSQGYVAERRPDGYIAGRPPNGQSPTGAGSGDPARPGEWRPPAPADAERGEGGQSAELSDRSLAKARGRGWALPKATQDSVAATRPIRIDCYPDRLVVAPGAGPGVSKTIPLSGPLERAVDPFISAIWDQIARWGLAGRNMYWRPVLHFYVAQGAETHYENLEALLDGSGLEVKRAGP